MSIAHAAASAVRQHAVPAVGVLAATAAVALAVGWAAARGNVQLALGIGLAIPIVLLILRFPWTAVLLWLAAMPFFTESDDGSAGPEVWLLHRMLIPGALALSVAYRGLGVARGRARVTLPDIAIVAFLLLAMTNIQLLSDNPMRMTVAFLDRFLVPICMYWLVRMVEPSDDEMQPLAWIVVGIVVMQATIGLLSWVAPGMLPNAWLGRAGERAVGTLRGPAPYTLTLIVGAMLLIPSLLRTSRPLSRFVYFAVIALAFIGVAVSFSRGSWLGAVIVLFGLLLFQRRIAFRVLLVLIVMAIPLTLGPFAEEIAFANERLGDDDTAASRLITNNAALQMISERPLLGWGYGEFERYDEAFKVRVGDIPVKEGSAHNTFLALGAENGLPALILYFLPAGWLAWLSIRRWRLIPKDDPLGRPLLVVMWLAILHSFTVMNFMDMIASSYWGTGLWWFALGLIHVVITRAPRAGSLPGSDDNAEPRVSP